MNLNTKCISTSSGDIWWGNVFSANVPFLINNNIHYIVNLGAYVPQNDISQLYIDANLKRYFYFPIADSEEQNLLPSLEQVSKIVEDIHKDRDSVLIHCYAGRNRSGAVVADLMCSDLKKKFPDISRYNLMENIIGELRAMTGGLALTNLSFVKQLVTLKR